MGDTVLNKWIKRKAKLGYYLVYKLIYLYFSPDDDMACCSPSRYARYYIQHWKSCAKQIRIDLSKCRDRPDVLDIATVSSLIPLLNDRPLYSRVALRSSHNLSYEYVPISVGLYTNHDTVINGGGARRIDVINGNYSIANDHGTFP